MLAQNNTSTGLRFSTHKTNRFGRHDFVRAFVFDHTVLMNTRFVLKGIGSHDGLVWLTRHARVFRHHFGCGCNVNGIDGRIKFSRSGSTLKLSRSLEGQCHDDFFQGRVSGAFANTVDGAFQLPCPIQGTCQGIGRGQTQIVLAMGAKHDIFRAHDVFTQLLNQATKFPWHVPPGGIGNIKCGGSGFDDGTQDAIQKFRIGPPRIFGTKFNVVASQALGEFYSRNGNLHYLVRCLV
mmetsp:Transcript_9687/g.18532  ORF Transcript_9687/g.18532 Transcript_9687/m.18532 type:complete len:236 (-) Transcript_9687:867-1574(-)